MKRAFYVVLALTVMGIGAAAAQDRAPYFEQRTAYLALGDSIPFGYNPFVPVALPLPTFSAITTGIPSS